MQFLKQLCRSAQSHTGLSFHNLNDGINGVPVAMAIMAVEWALFIVLAWYLDQVLQTGAYTSHPATKQSTCQRVPFRHELLFVLECGRS